MKLYRAIGRALTEMGVPRLFGLMGDANMLYIAAYRDLNSETAFVNSVHESGAVSMADGYARMSGAVGYVSVTHGPGVTNALTALTEAVRARTPLVVLVGDTPNKREHNQWLDLPAAARLSGASFRRVRSADDAIDDIALASRIAATRRRPVVLDVPVEFMHQEVSATPPKFRPMGVENVAISFDERALDEAAGLLASSNRPLILAGRGAVHSGARADLESMAEIVSAPLATTLLAKDYFSAHAHNVGVFGTLSHSLASRYIAESDCVVAVGTSLHDFTTMNGELLAGKRLIQCDTDVSVLGMRRPTDVDVLSDAATFAAAMRSAMLEVKDSQPTRWISRLISENRNFKASDDFQDRSTDLTLDMRTAMLVLDKILPAERAVVTDLGRFYKAAWRYLRTEPLAFAHTGNFGSVGLGIATAVGAAVARPDRLTVAVVGDGGGLMGVTELTRAVASGLPMLIVVLNDGSYGAEYTALGRHGMNTDYSLLAWPSFARVAQGFGVEAVTVKNEAELRALEPRLQHIDSPFLVDVQADPSVDPGAFNR
ncbi:thiamine pyrophosphate-binding protein [Serinicoccus sp. LYQ131]|uniref:thiamine pyrophosphate-binding protein n=1 Tax=Serinicoccus sp. LYQ131 TaxID=3378797 RepID=UPI0038523819